MAATFVAITAGLVALLGLAGNLTQPRNWQRTVVAALPIVAVVGAPFGLGGWNLAVVLGMTVAVVLGMLASQIGPAEFEPVQGKNLGQIWRVLSAVLVAIALGSLAVRWIVSLFAPIPILNPTMVGIVLVVAAVAAAAGGMALRGLIGTTTVIFLVLTVLLVVVGAVTGFPATLTDPLIEVTHSPVSWLWLLLGFVLGATSPALRQIRADGGSIIPGTIVVAVAMLLGLVALLSFNGGYLILPSFSLNVLAGFVGFLTPVVGTVVSVLFTIVALGAAAVQFQSALRSVQPLLPADAADAWWQSKWALGIVVGLIALIPVIRAVPLTPLLWSVVLIAITGWITNWWSSRRAADENDNSPVQVS